jgi:hypothetical protein
MHGLSALRANRSGELIKVVVQGFSTGDHHEGGSAVSSISDLSR